VAAFSFRLARPFAALCRLTGMGVPSRARLSCLAVLALLEGGQAIQCLEYPLSEDEALQFILTHHQTRLGRSE
jgi:hypothetical protein